MWFERKDNSMTVHIDSSIEVKIHQAINELLIQDSPLLQFDVNERTISHQLAIHIKREFSNWDVDCEYNRNHDDIKRLRLPREKVASDDTFAQTVFPDVIIHRRGTDDNLIVIEIKKSSNPQSSDRDFLKLNEFKKQLGYKYAVFVKFSVGEDKMGLEQITWV